MYFSFDTKRNKDYAKKQAERIAKLANNVCPTPFSSEIDVVEKDITIYLEELNKVYNLKTDTIKNRRFSAVSDIWGFIAPQLSYNAHLIFSYIIANIDFNSNIIKLTEEDFKSYCNLSKDSFYRGLKDLCKDNNLLASSGDNLKLLAKTTRKSLYIVNHNIIFKGNIKLFIDILNDKYPDGCKLDKYGKVILDK